MLAVRKHMCISCILSPKQLDSKGLTASSARHILVVRWQLLSLAATDWKTGNTQRRTGFESRPCSCLSLSCWKVASLHMPHSLLSRGFQRGSEIHSAVITNKCLLALKLRRDRHGLSSPGADILQRETRNQRLRVDQCSRGKTDASWEHETKGI